MKAVVHIGTEKTGTTSLQAFLATNRRRLPALGYAFLRSSGQRNHRDIVACCMNHDRIDDYLHALGITDPDKRRAWEQRVLDIAQRELESLATSVDTVILSSEHFHSRLVHEEELRRLKAVLSDTCTEIEIIVYLRRQDQVATSLHSTYLRTGGTGDATLPRNLHGREHYWNYEVLLTKWAAVFGRAHVTPRVFARDELLNGDLVQDFLHACGLDNATGMLIETEHENPSLDPMAQAFLRSYNQHAGDGANDQRRRVARELLGRLLSERWQGTPELPLRSEAEAFYALFRESNDRVAQSWFDRDHLFDEDFGKYPASRTVPSRTFEDAVRLFAGVWQDLIDNYVLLRRNGPLSQIIRQSDDADLFRHLALLFERDDPELAFHLIGKAKEHRPAGPSIVSKWSELRDALGKSAA